LAMPFAASSATLCRVAQYSSAARASTARRYREPAPTRPGLRLGARPRAGTEPLPARPRSSVQLTIATSVLRSSLIPARPEIIPAWLMGHGTTTGAGSGTTMTGATSGVAASSMATARGGGAKVGEEGGGCGARPGSVRWGRLVAAVGSAA
jgi:hypothetical protein